MKNIAGIVLFNPQIARLQQAIDAIIGQCDELILVDNASSNINEIFELINNNAKIKFIQNETNEGIAKALNQIAAYARNQNYEWVLTLDQDSVAPTNIFETYAQYQGMPNLGMICCKYADKNFGCYPDEVDKNQGWEFVETCITSASMLNLNAWETVGGFCDEMFIDAVDFDICCSLTEKGYKILKTYDITLFHEIGFSRLKTIGNKKLLITNHSPIRAYYMVRNSIYLGKRHGQPFNGWINAFKRICIVLLFEKNRKKKIHMMIKGMYHSIINQYGKYV